MKISQLQKELEYLKAEHGDIEVQLQNEPTLSENAKCYPEFFVVCEEYDDGLWVSLRSWPY